MRRLFFRWQALVLGIVLAVFLGVGVAAASEADDAYRMSYVQDGKSNSIDSDDADSSVYVPNSGFFDSWQVPTTGIRVSKQLIDGSNMLQLNFRSAFSSDEMEITYQMDRELAGYGVLFLPLNIITEDEAYSGNYRVTVTMTLPSEPHAEAERIIYTQAWVSANSWQEIVMDLSGADIVESMTVTVDVSDGVVPKMIRFQPYYFDVEQNTDYMDRYKTQRFSAVGGRLTTSHDRVLFHPFGGTAGLEGNFVLRESPKNGTQAFMMVTLSGQINSGTAAMGIRSAHTGNVSYADSGLLKLVKGRTVYLFPFIASDDMLSYRLLFRNADFHGDGILVESVELVFTEDVPLQSTGNGFVSAITLNRENGRLTLQGNVSQKVVKENKKDELVVYAVPYTQSLEVRVDGAIRGGTELLRSKLFMNFELVLDAEQTSRYVGTHMFYVTVEGEGHDPYLISQPRGADYEWKAGKDNSIVGIEGASAVGAFESNASHVIVDLYFDRLILSVTKPGAETEEEQMINTDAVKVYHHDGTEILLDGEGLREILAEISFYNSANLRVYLRIANMEGSFVNNVFRLNEWETEIYSCVLSAILETDRAVMTDAAAGVILGEAVAYSEEYFANGGAERAYDYTAGLSALMNVTYSTVQSCLNTSEVAIIVPFMTKGEYNGIVAEMLAFHNASKSGVPWYIMYGFSLVQNDSDLRYEEAVSDAGRLIEAAGAFGAEGESAGCLYFCVPSENMTADEMTLEYNFFCESVEESELEAVFLSVRGVLDERKEQLYRLLKNIRKEENNSVIETIHPEYITDELSEQRYTVWDFSTLYHNDGWISGGAVSGCGTERSEIFSQYSGISKRALRTKVYSNYENSMASAIVLRNFNQAIDLGGVDYVVFRFSLAETEDASTLIFVMGNEQIRAEYPLTDVEPGKVHTVRCPVSDFSGKERVAYIGAMVYSGESAVLEIQSVDLESETLTHGEMATLFEPPAPPLPEKSNTGYVVLGVLGVITVFAAVMLIRRDREEAEQKNEAVATRFGMR